MTSSFSFVEFERAEEIPWSNKGRIGSLFYSWEMVEVYNVQVLEWVTSRRMLSGAYGVVEEYAKVRIFFTAL